MTTPLDYYGRPVGSTTCHICLRPWTTPTHGPHPTRCHSFVGHMDISGRPEYSCLRRGYERLAAEKMKAST